LAALEQHSRSRRNPFTNTLLTMSNTINMHNFGLKMIAGVAIAGTVTLAMGTSAQAAVIGRFDFGGTADLNTNSINFTNVGSFLDNFAADGTFSPLALDPEPPIPGYFTGISSTIPVSIGSIKDLASFGTIALPTLPVSIASFINFEADPNLTLAQKVKFRFTLTEFFQSTSDKYEFKGVFGDGTLGQGRIGTFETINNALTVRGYAGRLEALAVEVPTPALLPGLIGIGIAAMRKRQSKTATA
jgi:hypothetical protein